MTLLEQYGVNNISDTIGTALEVILDDNKDAVDEIVTQFVEKIEAEAGVKDSMITKGRNGEWTALAEGIQQAQHNRGR